MTKRITRQGCTVETTCTIQTNGTYTESVVLSVDPTSKLSLAIEERAQTFSHGQQGPTLRRGGTTAKALAYEERAALDIGAGRSHYPQSSRKVRR